MVKHVTGWYSDTEMTYERSLAQSLTARLSVGFGVSGSALTWLKSYLTGRYQCVGVGQTSSSHTLCHTGVPQDSVLVLSFSRVTYPQSVSLQTHLASAYSSMLTIHNYMYRCLRQICTHNSHYFPPACLLCTVGFVTTAWLSIALNLNLF